MKIPKVENHGTGFRVRWTDIQSIRQCEYFSGKHDAQFFAHQKIVEREEMKRGLKGVLIRGMSFLDLCDYYLKNDAKNKRSFKHDELNVRVHLLPYFRYTPLKEVCMRVEEYKTTKNHLASKTIHNHLTLLITMLRVAKRQQWIDEVPTIKKPKIDPLNKDYCYLRTQEEMLRFLGAAKKESEIAHVFYSTAIFTGLRAGELAGLMWVDIDFERRLIRVHRSYEGPTKNGKTRFIPILDPLLPVLREWKLRNTLQHVFFSQAGTPLKPSARLFQEVLHRILTSAGLEPKEGDPKTRAGRMISLHSTRHTLASHWSMNGGDRYKLQKALGHQSQLQTERYSHLRPEAFETEHKVLGNTELLTGLNQEAVILHLKGSGS